MLDGIASISLYQKERHHYLHKIYYYTKLVYQRSPRASHFCFQNNFGIASKKYSQNKLNELIIIDMRMKYEISERLLFRLANGLSFIYEKYAHFLHSR